MSDTNSLLLKIVASVEKLALQQSALDSKVESLSRRVDSSRNFDPLSSPSFNPISSPFDTSKVECNIFCLIIALDTLKLSSGFASPVQSPNRRASDSQPYNSRIVLTTYPEQVGIKPVPIKWGIYR